MNINPLNTIHGLTGKITSAKPLQQASRGFEALFIRQVLEFTKTSESDSRWQDMMLDSFSEDLAASEPLGIATLLQQQLNGEINLTHPTRDPGTPAAEENSDWHALAGQAAERYGLPPSLVKAVVEAESSGVQDALSRAGAQGLMQLMPATARELGVVDPFDPAQNIDGGTRYLAQLLQRFEGDTDLALAAYNAGPGAVERHGGVPPYPETERYVRKVKELMTP